jgi:hypothetical protein
MLRLHRVRRTVVPLGAHGGRTANRRNTGRVTRVGTASPVQGAQVQIVGTERGAVTDALGRFLITAVPAGSHIIRAQFLGFGAVERPVTVESGGTAQVAIELREEAIALDAVVEIS